MRAPEIFQRFFAPLYPPNALADLDATRATDANPGHNPRLLVPLQEAAQIFAQLAPKVFGRELSLDFSDASVHRLGEALTREVRDHWLEDTGDVSVESPPLLAHVVTHGAAYVGECIVRNHAGFWQLRNPSWESMVRLTSSAGTGDLAVFMWWLKSLDDEEIDRPGLSDRYRLHVEVPTFDASKLRVIAPPDRRLPRLSRVRYDTLHKYLKAQLPELKTVGDDFPSPERLAEMDFRWLDFALLGEGRMLLMHGPTKTGVHLFWLDADGFTKSAYYETEKPDTYRLEVAEDKLVVSVPFEGRTTKHEMLWWGA